MTTRKRQPSGSGKRATSCEAAVTAAAAAASKPRVLPLRGNDEAFQRKPDSLTPKVSR